MEALTGLEQSMRISGKMRGIHCIGAMAQNGSKGHVS